MEYSLEGDQKLSGEILKSGIENQNKHCFVVECLPGNVAYKGHLLATILLHLSHFLRYQR